MSEVQREKLCVTPFDRKPLLTKNFRPDMMTKVY